MRKLASIQKIKSLTPIPSADRIELARVLGWKCVVKKGEFKVGDKCVYIEIDSIPPSDNPVFDFLKHSNGKMDRVKTIKLRGQVSQGLAMPVNLFDGLEKYNVGDDVTKVLGIKKWEPDERNKVSLSQNPLYMRRFHNHRLKWLYDNPWCKLFDKWLYVKSRAKFPLFLNKTDETRVQVLGDMLEKYKGTECYVTEKIDGQSITIWFDGNSKMHVASRNYEILDKEDYMWAAIGCENIEAKVRACSFHLRPKCFFLQGELIGPGIQANRYNKMTYFIYFFNSGFCDSGKVQYNSIDTLLELADKVGLRTVPMLNDNYKLESDIDSIVEMSRGKSVLLDVPREGIVIRPKKDIYDNQIEGMVGNRISFKAINPDFLIKNDV